MSTKLKKEYDKDFYLWTMQNAKLIRQGKLSEIDVENIAEEIESMGRSDKRELINRLAVLIAHFLKWKFQPERRSNSWKITIREQRANVKELLNDSPSLKHEIENKIIDAYKKALFIAMRETGFSVKTFPKKCPFTLDQCLHETFFPT